MYVTLNTLNGVTHLDLSSNYIMSRDQGFKESDAYFSWSWFSNHLPWPQEILSHLLSWPLVTRVCTRLQVTSGDQPHLEKSLEYDAQVVVGVQGGDTPHPMHQNRYVIPLYFAWSQIYIFPWPPSLRDWLNSCSSTHSRTHGPMFWVSVLGPTCGHRSRNINICESQTKQNIISKFEQYSYWEMTCLFI